MSTVHDVHALLRFVEEHPEDWERYKANHPRQIRALRERFAATPPAEPTSEGWQEALDSYQNHLWNAHGVTSRDNLEFQRLRECISTTIKEQRAEIAALTEQRDEAQLLAFRGMFRGEAMPAVIEEASND